mmetsp:Transcript_52662/g.92441  ORF Transcript_52662/g.92441 Transcript_52662/m.92441 type:complete len:208 (-) Transcript_52662:842-1465(-)
MMVQPEARRMLSRSPGRARSAFKGMYLMIKSIAFVASSRSSEARPLWLSLQRYLCQKMTGKDEQMGAPFQQSCNSLRTCSLLLLLCAVSVEGWLSMAAGNKNARTAVYQLQFAWFCFISSITDSLRSRQDESRNSDGHCHNSTTSGSSSSNPTIVPLRSTSPWRMILPDLGSTYNNKSVSWMPSVARVLSMTGTWYISSTLPTGHIP